MPEIHISQDNVGEFIGQGEAKIVHGHKHNEKKVVATENQQGREVYVDPNLAKMQYYIGKILFELFPDNFPSISYAQGGDKKPAQYIRERIHPDSKQYTDKEFKKARDALIKRVRDVGFLPREMFRGMVKTGPMDEMNSSNFVWRDGQLVYIDDLEPIMAGREPTIDAELKNNSDLNFTEIFLTRTDDEIEDNVPLTVIDNDLFLSQVDNLPEGKKKKVLSFYNRYLSLLQEIPLDKPIAKLKKNVLVESY